MDGVALEEGSLGGKDLGEVTKGWGRGMKHHKRIAVEISGIYRGLKRDGTGR